MPWFEILRSAFVLAGVVLGLWAWDVPQRLRAKWRRPVIINPGNPESLAFAGVALADGWRLALRMSNKTAGPMPDCNVEIHGLEIRSKDGPDFLPESEALLAHFHGPRMIDAEDSGLYPLIDATEMLYFTVEGSRPGGGVWNPQRSKPGLYRMRLVIEAGGKSRTVSVFFSWRPGHKPRFERDPRVGA
jgi:hypothetical protein